MEAAKRLREEDIEQVAERLKDKFKQNMVYLNKNLGKVAPMITQYQAIIA